MSRRAGVRWWILGSLLIGGCTFYESPAEWAEENGRGISPLTTAHAIYWIAPPGPHPGVSRAEARATLKIEATYRDVEALCRVRAPSNLEVHVFPDQQDMLGYANYARVIIDEGVAGAQWRVAGRNVVILWARSPGLLSGLFGSSQRVRATLAHELIHAFNPQALPPWQDEAIAYLGQFVLELRWLGEALTLEQAWVVTLASTLGVDAEPPTWSEEWWRVLRASGLRHVRSSRAGPTYRAWVSLACALVLGGRAEGLHGLLPILELMEQGPSFRREVAAQSVELLARFPREQDFVLAVRSTRRDADMLLRLLSSLPKARPGGREWRPAASYPALEACLTDPNPEVVERARRLLDQLGED